jgi:hypothetical protein
MRRTLLFLALAALPLAVTACGAGSAANALQSVANAATKTVKQQSEHVHLDMSETVGAVGPIKITADGVTDNTTHSAQMTIDLSSISALLGGTAGPSDQWKGEAIVDGSNGGFVEYMRLPALTKNLPNGKTWLKIDLQKLGKQQGVDFSQLLQTTGAQDPTQTLQLLQSIGDVKKVGTEQVNGVDTTEYSGTVDLKKFSAKYGAGFGKLYKQLGTSTVPMQVWISSDGLVRKLHETLSGTIAGAGRMDLDLTVTLSDFGASVSITPPPADQVADISQLQGANG